MLEQRLVLHLSYLDIFQTFVDMWMIGNKWVRRRVQIMSVTCTGCTTVTDNPDFRGCCLPESGVNLFVHISLNPACSSLCYNVTNVTTNLIQHKYMLYQTDSWEVFPPLAPKTHSFLFCVLQFFGKDAWPFYSEMERKHEIWSFSEIFKSSIFSKP